MACMSLLSTYIKIKAIIDIKGKEAMIAPKVELRFAISEITVMSRAEVIILIR